MKESLLYPNLAGYLASRGKTLLVDGDPIRTCLLWNAQGPGLPFPVVEPEQADPAGQDHVVGRLPTLSAFLHWPRMEERPY